MSCIPGLRSCKADAFRLSRANFMHHLPWTFPFVRPPFLPVDTLPCLQITYKLMILSKMKNEGSLSKLAIHPPIQCILAVLKLGYCCSRHSSKPSCIINNLILLRKFWINLIRANWAVERICLMWFSFINEIDHLKSKSDWVGTKTLNSSQIMIGEWFGRDILLKLGWFTRLL